MDLFECKEAYLSLSKIIFQRRTWQFVKYFYNLIGRRSHCGKALKHAVNEVVRTHLKSPERDIIKGARWSAVSLVDPICSPTKTYVPTAEFVRCRIVNPISFVCTTVDGSHAVRRLRTYKSNQDVNRGPWTISQACRATTAAPSYFPPLRLRGRTYWDGAMKANNPIAEVIHEAKSEFGEGSYFKAIVSIGTGRAKHQNPPSNAMTFINYALQQIADTQAKHEEFEAHNLGLRDRYFRFNEDKWEDRLHRIDLAAWEMLPEVEKLANEYVNSVDGSDHIKRCALNLAQRQLEIPFDLGRSGRDRPDPSRRLFILSPEKIPSALDFVAFVFLILVCIALCYHVDSYVRVSSVLRRNFYISFWIGLDSGGTHYST